MSRLPRVRLLAAVLALACAGSARAASVLAVLSSDSGHYRQAYEGFQEAWGSSVPVVLLGQDVPPVPRDAIVAFGSRAALRQAPESSLLVTCLALGARPESRGETLQVELLPSPPLLAGALKKLLPRLTKLRVLWSSSFEKEDVEALAAAARARGFAVVSERVPQPADLPARVRAFSGGADALWLMPDPALVNAQNFKTLREYAAASRTPFLAPTEGLAEKGATATLAASFREVGRTAAAALKARLLGGPAPERVFPERIVVTVNASAARAVGMDLNAASGVDRTIP
jgi:hypothetical protein